VNQKYARSRSTRPPSSQPKESHYGRRRLSLAECPPLCAFSSCSSQLEKQASIRKSVASFVISLTIRGQSEEANDLVRVLSHHNSSSLKGKLTFYSHLFTVHGTFLHFLRINYMYSTIFRALSDTDITSLLRLRRQPRKPIDRISFSNMLLIGRPYGDFIKKGKNLFS
jgi:hypothetical protein